MEEREVSFGLFSFELNRWRRWMIVVGRPKWYLYLLGPNGCLWAALPPYPKQVESRDFWLGKRI